MAEWKEVATQWKRMCKVFWTPVSCKGCPIVEHERAYGACSAADVDVVSMEEIVMSWAAENPEPVYPSWLEAMGWGELQWCEVKAILEKPMDSENANKLGIEPKEVR